MADSVSASNTETPNFSLKPKAQEIRGLSFVRMFSAHVCEPSRG